MSKLMWIAGILLLAAGVALGVMVFVSTASIVAWGIDLHIAVNLVIGGFLALGLGSVISGLETLRIAQDAVSYQPAVNQPATTIPEFGRRTAEVVEQAAAPLTAVAAAEEIEVSAPVKETIQALEQARQKIEQAFDAKPESAAAASVAPLAKPEAAAEVAASVDETETADTVEDEGTGSEVAGEAQLYVVEERMIRARPARILSDGTVEAETEEGWMRFENLEHLDEYLDAMSSTA